MSHSKTYSGVYIGEVVSVADPEKKCRVKVNVFDVFDGVPIAALPWATFILPLGSRAGEGEVCPVQVGDQVWVQFVGNDTRRPLIVGAAQAMPGGIVNLAPDVFQGAGQYAHKRTDREPQVSAPPYYEDFVLCQNRALIQFCRSGNIRVTQMDSGSAIEILPSGDMVAHCEGNLFTSVAGNVLQTVNGNVTQEVGGNVSQKISGDVSQTANGNISIQSSVNVSITAPTIGLNGAISTRSATDGAGTMSIHGDIEQRGSQVVTGDVTASNISLASHTHTCPDGTTSSPK